MAGFLIRKWPNRLFFNGKMVKKLIKTKGIGAAVLLLIFIQIVVPFTANAAIFDWLSGLRIKREIYISGNQALSSTAPYLSADFRLSEPNKQKVAEGLILIQGSFLAAYNSPKNLESLDNYKNLNVKIRELVVPITAYSSTPDQTDESPFITAWGTYVRDGIVAANFLPFGTKIKIPGIFGDKIFVVEDRMNSRHVYKIDIWFPDRQSALEFGIKTTKIQIVES